MTAAGVMRDLVADRPAWSAVTTAALERVLPVVSAKHGRVVHAGVPTDDPRPLCPARAPGGWLVLPAGPATGRRRCVACARVDPAGWFPTVLTTPGLRRSLVAAVATRLTDIESLEDLWTWTAAVVLAGLSNEPTSVTETGGPAAYRLSWLIGQTRRRLTPPAPLRVKLSADQMGTL